MVKRKYRTRKTCKYYKQPFITGVGCENRECFAFWYSWHCWGITYCGMYKEKSK